jgi:predicted DsbA family dithiol-disulfide isomerase
MKIDIISDVACPWCYIGKKNLEAAIAQRPNMKFEIQWFPYQLHPEAPPEGYDYRASIERKYGKERINMMFAQIKQVAKAAGIDMDLDKIERGANTLKAHRLLDLAWQQGGSEGPQNDLSEALLRAYLCEGKDVGDIEILADLAAGVGMDKQQVRDYLSGDDDTDKIQAQIDFARQQGVSGVPSFSFDGMFALSGGQQPDVFLNVIDRIAQKVEAEGAFCTPDTCP